MTHRNLRIILPVFLLFLTVVSMTNMGPVFASSPPPVQRNFSGWAGKCTAGSNCVGGTHSNGFLCSASTCSGLTSGSGDGQFSSVRGVVGDSSGNVYVADLGNSRVELFSGGVFSGWAGKCTAGSNCVGGTHSNGFTCTASTCSGLALGSGDGQFGSPEGVGVDSSGNIYVTDSSNSRVELFSGGVFSGSAGGCTGGANCVGGAHSNGFTCTAATCTGVGTSGSGDGQFNNPIGVVVDSSGNVYVADSNNNRVVKFSGGVFVGWAGLCTSGSNCDTVNQHSNGFTCTDATCSGLARGSGDGEFSGLTFVAVDSSGNVYVADYFNNRVEKFSGSGFVGWAGACTSGSNCVGGTHSNGFTCTASTCSGLALGSGDGQFSNPYGVVVDSSGNVYVADYVNKRVEKFSGSGFVGWAGACTSGSNCVRGTHSNGFTCTAATCTGVGTTGSGDGQINQPFGVGVDSLGNVYVADLSNGRVEKFVEPIGLKGLSGFTGNSTGQILLVLGDFCVNPHGTKPPGVGCQSGRDTTPLGFLSGMLTNTQPTVYDTNPAYVNSSTGRPLAGGYSTIIVPGGPLINAVSHYYMTTSIPGDQAPVLFSSSGSNSVWTDQNGTVVLTVPQSSNAVPPGTSDVFTVEVFKDAGNRTIALMFGTTYMGTWAAAWYFKYQVYPNISTYPNGYYLIRWTDAASGSSANDIPDSGDTFTILATSPS